MIWFLAEFWALCFVVWAFFFLVKLGLKKRAQIPKPPQKFNVQKCTMKLIRKDGEISEFEFAGRVQTGISFGPMGEDSVFPDVILASKVAENKLDQWGDWILWQKETESQPKILIHASEVRVEIGNVRDHFVEWKNEA